MKIHRLSLINLTVLMVFNFTAPIALAQSANTETTEKGRTYFEGNLWTATQRHSRGGMQNYGGRFAYGITRNVEAGLGGAFADPYDTEYPPEIQPSVKWKFYQNEKRGIIASGGAIAFLPVARKTGTDAFVMFYGNLSKDFKAFKEPRLTVGVYALAARNPAFGSRRGFNFVYDQPISKKLSFSAQWVTGKNRFGYFTPGLNIETGKNGNLFIGYGIGNYDYDNHGPYFSYSFLR